MRITHYTLIYVYQVIYISLISYLYRKFTLKDAYRIRNLGMGCRDNKIYFRKKIDLHPIKYIAQVKEDNIL